MTPPAQAASRGATAASGAPVCSRSQPSSAQAAASPVAQARSARRAARSRSRGRPSPTACICAALRQARGRPSPSAQSSLSAAPAAAGSRGRPRPRRRFSARIVQARSSPPMQPSSSRRWPWPGVSVAIRAAPEIVHARSSCRGPERATQRVASESPSGSRAQPVSSRCWSSSQAGRQPP
ncbi:MAG: hypothetical protein ACK559_42090, partial [bacterium]